MSFTIETFKFFYVMNYLTEGLSYNTLYKSNSCQIQKLEYSCNMNSVSVSHEKLKRVDSVAQENFYSNLKRSRISKEGNEMFLKQTFYRGYVNIKVLLR